MLWLGSVNFRQLMHSCRSYRGAARVKPTADSAPWCSFHWAPLCESYNQMCIQVVLITATMKGSGRVIELKKLAWLSNHTMGRAFALLVANPTLDHQHRVSWHGVIFKPWALSDISWNKQTKQKKQLGIVRSICYCNSSNTQMLILLLSFGSVK